MIVANTFMRSLIASTIPLFAWYMCNGIVISYGNTFLGVVAAVLVPLPFMVYFKGTKIRARTTFAPLPDIEHDKKKPQEKNIGSDSHENSAK